MITTFNDYDKMNESVSLTDDEKKYLWSKVEYLKKKHAINTENELYDLLNSDKKEFTKDEFALILKSLEYRFRKKISGMDKPLNSELFKEIQEKLPKDWIGVKYSSLKSKEEKENKKSSED